MRSAIAAVSTGVIGSRSHPVQPTGQPDHRRRADLHVQVRALPDHELLEPTVELRNGGITVLHCATPRLERWPRTRTHPRSVPPSPIGPSDDGLQRDRRSGRAQVPATTRQTELRSARGSNACRWRRGRDPSNIPSSRPLCTEHTSSLCSSSRSRNGQPRRAISTVRDPLRRKRGSNPASASASLEPRQVRPRTASTGRRGVPGDQVVAPLASEGVGTRPSARPGRERRQDVREQAVVTPLPVARGHSGVDRLGAADGRRASPRLRGDEARVREPTQVWTDRVGVQTEAGGELANGDRAAGQAQVPIEPVARVVREGLVDLDRGRFVHLRISYDGLCTVNTVSTRA